MRTIATAIVFTSLLFPAKAYCYLDPGTGSYVLQVIAAALLGLMFSVKAFWGKVKAFLSRFK